MNHPKISLNLIDKAIGYFDPMALKKRAGARMAMAALEEGGYITPNSSRKSMKGVAAVGRSPDRDTAPKISGSRALSRDMYMNTPLMVAALRRCRTNIVGAGLLAQPSVDARFLGLTDEEAMDWVRNTQREFDLWATSPQADFSGRLNFFEMQALMVLSVMMNGDAFFLLPWKKSNLKGWPYRLRVKMVEGDLVRNPDNIPDTGYTTASGPDIISGIETVSGEVVAFHIASGYPTDYSGLNTTTRVDVTDKNGRRQAFQLADFERIGQRRGMPLLAPVLETMKQMSRLTESELMAHLVSSFFTVFVRDKSGMGGTLQEPFTPPETLGGGGAWGPEAPPEEKTVGAEFDVELGHGNVAYLDDDKDITIADPNRTNNGFPAFFEALVTQISAACEIPREQLLLKFESSYSASRGAIIEAWKFWRSRRAWLSRNFNQPIYEAFLEEAVARGRIECPGFWEDPAIRAAWCSCGWVGPGMGQLDPLKEAQASAFKIEKRLSTYEQEYAADHGGRWAGSMDRLRRETDHLDALGLEVPIAPGAAAPQEPNHQPDGEGNQPPDGTDDGSGESTAP